MGWGLGLRLECVWGGGGVRESNTFCVGLHKVYYIGL